MDLPRKRAVCIKVLFPSITAVCINNCLLYFNFLSHKVGYHACNKTKVEPENVVSLLQVRKIDEEKVKIFHNNLEIIDDISPSHSHMSLVCSAM